MLPSLIKKINTELSDSVLMSVQLLVTKFHVGVMFMLRINNVFHLIVK